MSGLLLFKQLLTKECCPGMHWDSARNRLKFAARSLFMPLSTMKYLSGLTNTACCDAILKKQPLLPTKLQRPYLSINFHRKNKSAAICDHYRITKAVLPPAVFSRIYSNEQFYLCPVEGKESLCHLWLDVQDAFNKEGELTLEMRDDAGEILARSAFTLLNLNEKRSLFIGALQGGVSEQAHNAIRAATKNCHGVFPKRILTEVICLIASLFQCQQIIATSNETHIYRSRRYRHKKLTQWVADYNSFWESVGGTANPQHEYVIPLTLPRKPIDEIASKKRAEYRRRYQLLYNVAQAVCERLQLPQPENKTDVQHNII
ncbi:VirK/YbjX family protein [Morganella morganii]